MLRVLKEHIGFGLLIGIVAAIIGYSIDMTVV